MINILNFYQTLQNQGYKHMSKDFVSKLSQMLDNKSDSVRWNDEGTQFQIIDLKLFEKEILGNYFRHQRFDSFVRQLNMYGFRKISRKKSELSFRHEYFVRGKREHYYKIKRKTKSDKSMNAKKELANKVKEEVNQMKETEPVFAQLFRQLSQFKQIAHQNNRKLKDKIDHLVKEVSWKKNRQIKPVIIEIKESLSQMDHAYKGVGETANHKFVPESKEDSETFSMPKKEVEFSPQVDKCRKDNEKKLDSAKSGQFMSFSHLSISNFLF